MPPRPCSLPVTAALLIAAMGCGAAQPHASRSPDRLDPDVVRYRLLLRQNPVDPGEAFRCYGGCQSRTSPNDYLQCLTECPGFEITEGIRCAQREVPPIAACFTARRVRAGTEVDPNYVALALLANVLLIVSLASVCASSPTQCGYGYGYPYSTPQRY